MRFARSREASALLHGDLRLRGAVVGLVAVVVALRHGLGLEKSLSAVPVRLGEGETRLALLEAGLGAFDAGFGLDDAGLGAFVRGFGVLEVGLVRHVVDLRQHHAGRHAGTEVDRIAVGVLAETHDLAVDLRADVHELFRLDCAGGGNGADHVAADDLFGLKDDFLVGLAAGIAAQDDPADGEHAEYNDEDEEFFQELFHVETAFMLCFDYVSV